MTPETFLQRVAEQPTVSVDRAVRIPGPELQAFIASGKPLLLSELVAHPDQRQEVRSFRHGHLVGEGVTPQTLDAWQAGHPEHPLPADLRRFLAYADGVHLWADLDDGRSYFGILPLREWKDTRELDWATPPFRIPPEGLAISYHENGDFYLALDTRGPHYFWYDLGDYNSPRRVGGTIEALLEFWWKECEWLDPRREAPAT